MAKKLYVISQNVLLHTLKQFTNGSNTVVPYLNSSDLNSSDEAIPTHLSHAQLQKETNAPNTTV